MVIWQEIFSCGHCVPDSPSRSKQHQKQTGFPISNAFHIFHHFSTCSSLPRYEFERVSTTRHGFRSDPTRHCSDGHPLPRGTHRLRAGPDGFTGDLRRLLAGSVHVPCRNWHCTAPEKWIHMCICMYDYVRNVCIVCVYIYNLTYIYYIYNIYNIIYIYIHLYAYYCA